VGFTRNRRYPQLNPPFSRGHRQEVLNPLFGYKPSEQSKLAPEHPDFSPDLALPPKLLFPTTPTRRSLRSTVRRRSPSPGAVADRGPMEEEAEPLEQSPTRSFKTESSPSDSSTSLDDQSSYISSSLSSYLGPPTPQDIPSVPSVPVSDKSAGSSLSKTSEGSLSLLSMGGVRPLPSPTPSVTSEGTVRGPEIPLANLRSLLEGLRRQANALERGQALTDELINELKGRIREPSLGKIEDMLQELLNRVAIPPQIPPPPPTEPETEEAPPSCHQGYSVNVLRLSYRGTENRSRDSPTHACSRWSARRPLPRFPGYVDTSNRTRSTSTSRAVCVPPRPSAAANYQSQG
jgi:hypothetical protein